MEWESVKELLPTEGQFVNVRKRWTYPKKVCLVKVEDKCMRSGFVYEWRYKSGIYAGSLDEEDEWKVM